MAPLTPYFVWSSNSTSSLRRSASTAFLVFAHRFADVNLLSFIERTGTFGLPPGLLPSAPPGVVLYIHLFAPHVLFDDLLLVDDVLANADLLFHHRLFLDHDLVLYHRHGYLVGAYLGLRTLAAYRHPLDAYLLA